MKQLFKDDNAKKNPMKDDTKYSRAIKVPQYEPSDSKPVLETVYITEKYNKLIAKIKKSNVSEEEKKFLKFAASRHIVFNYSKIADYYAHADAEMQDLMEESALVILDMNDAIANGYIALTEKMQQLIDEEKERDARAKESADVLKKQRQLMEEKAKAEREKKKKESKSDDNESSSEQSDSESTDTKSSEEVSE